MRVKTARQGLSGPALALVPGDIPTLSLPLVSQRFLHKDSHTRILTAFYVGPGVLNFSPHDCTTRALTLRVIFLALNH